METVSPRVCLLHNYRESQQVSMMLYAERLGDALQRKGLDVRRLRPPDLLPLWWRKLGLVDKLDSYAGRFLWYPLFAKKQRADLFNIVDHGQAFLLRILDPARTVVTCHDIILLVLASGRLGSTFRPPFATNVLRHSLKAMRRTRWIIADSEQTRRDLAALAGVDPANVRVIFPGLNHPFAPAPDRREATRARFGLGPGPLVLQVGQTGFYKNLDGCLRVVKELRTQGLDVSFVRAGHRMRPGHRRLQERLGLDGAVRDLGSLSDEGLASLYAACDVLLFPSLYEGFGWPPLEAMASGLPVVCSRSGSLPEVVADAALTAEPEDVRGLAAHVAAVLTERKLAAELRRRGLERARLFDWDRTAAQVLAVYREVLES